MSNDLNSFLFSTPEMTRVFSAKEQLRAMMRFEWALTCALEANGLAETGSGPVLESLLDAGFVDVERLRARGERRWEYRNSLRPTADLSGDCAG